MNAGIDNLALDGKCEIVCADRAKTKSSLRPPPLVDHIREWLDHSDISTTANIYSHLDYKSKLTSANVMDNVLTLPEAEAVGWQT